MAITSPRPPDRVSLPKVIESRERLLSVFGVHGMAPQELPAFIGK
jgi:hypothetical protein